MFQREEKLATLWDNVLWKVVLLLGQRSARL